LAGASLALPSVVRGQESIFDIMNRGNVLRNVDKDGNTAAAQATIATNEPILSYATGYNLQLAISQYGPFGARGGWEEVPQEAYQLLLGKSGAAVIALKRRLIASGDMVLVPNITDMFDQDADRGLRTFQARHGLIV